MTLRFLNDCFTLRSGLLPNANAYDGYWAEADCDNLKDGPPMAGQKMSFSNN
jgi:hypothetical protein